MSKLYEAPRKGAFGEAWLAVKFSFKNIKTWLPNQFWPALLMAILLSVFAYGGGKTLHVMMELRTEISRMQTEMPQTIPRTAPPATPSAEGNSRVSNDMMMPSSFKQPVGAELLNSADVPEEQMTIGLNQIAIIGGLIIVAIVAIMASLMSAVLFMRYMVLGEGQYSSSIPKFCFGKREMRVLGWSILVFLAVSLPVGFIVPMAINKLAGITDPNQGAIATQIFGIIGSIIALRFSFLRVSAACDHPTTFLTGWRQMSGFYGSFLLANVAITLIGLLPVGVVMGLLVTGVIMALKFMSAGAFIAMCLLVGLMFTLVYLIMTAAYSALLGRYYHFATQK